MTANSVHRYWEFEECKKVVGFSTIEFPGKPCWEMASDVEDVRSEFNICEDCIVYLMQNGTSLLSEKEIHSIGDRHVCCKFFYA